MTHQLAIETGRYTVPKTPIENRTCFFCNQIEDEFHVLYQCSLYNDEREYLMEQLSSFSNISINPSNESFRCLMSYNHGDVEVGKILCSFINKSFEKRSSKTHEIKEREKYIRPAYTSTKFGRLSKRPNRMDL